VHAVDDRFALSNPALLSAPSKKSFCQLDRDEFRSAPPLNQSPFIPAKAGIQGRESGQELGPRFRGDERT
jgi:hypothetical protein